MVQMFQPTAAIDVSDLTETEAESTAAATAQAEFDAAPGLALAGDSADIDGEKATDAEIEQAQTELFDAGNSPADANGNVKLTEVSMRQHRDSLPDRFPSRATSTSLRGEAAAAASLVPAETYGMPETEEPRLEEPVSPMAEKAPSVSSVLDTLPPGSEAGLSLATTMDSFDSRTATRSQASTRSCGNVEEILPLCTKCGFPTEVFNACLRTKASSNQHAKYVCRPCNSIQTMVYRNLKQEGSLKISSWDDEQVQEFFRKAQEETKKDGRAKWERVRFVMKQCMLKRVIEATEKKINSEYKPLGVWEKLGYNVEMIAAYNKTEWNPACGMCYAVPLKSICWTRKEEEIEERIAKAELQGGGRKEEDAADSDAGDEVTPPPTGREAKRRKLEADAAKEAKKELAAVKAHNSKMQILASKTVTALSNGCDALKKVTQGKNFRNAPTFMAEKIGNDFDTAAGYLKEADNVLKLIKKCAKDGTRLPTMSYDVRDLANVCKAVKKDRSDFEAFEKLCR